MSTTVYGDNIKSARKAKHISAEQLGEMLNPPVTYAAIYAWEKGRNEPSISYLLQLCDVLGVDISDLINLPIRDAGGESDEIIRYMTRMSDNQRTAVLGVARAMVDC